jgi:hypothetical protein
MNFSTAARLQSLFLSLLSQILSHAPGLRLLPLICPHQMSRGQRVTYHRSDDILSTRPALKLEFSVERIDPEAVWKICNWQRIDPEAVWKICNWQRVVKPLKEGCVNGHQAPSPAMH